jgi:hypothetical protein
MGLASLGGITFQVNPYNVSWDCSLKVVKKRTVGGYVVQILGVHVGDLTVSGVFAHGTTANDGLAWQEQERFRQQIKSWADSAEQDINSTITFSFPDYGWNFEVYVKDFSSQSGPAVRLDNKIVAPDWTVTLFIVQDKTKVVVKGIEDIYLKRLFNGVGWKQTSYNGIVNADEAQAFIQANGGTLGGVVQNSIIKASQGNFSSGASPSSSSSDPPAASAPLPGSTASGNNFPK